MTSGSLLDAERDLQRGIRNTATEAGYTEDEIQDVRSQRAHEARQATLVTVAWIASAMTREI